MQSFGKNEIGQKMKSAVKAKLVEIGGSAAYIDDELPDYVMIMVANRRSKQQMITDLNLFLGEQTELFVTWLHEVLQKLQEVTLPASALTSLKKRKSSHKEKDDVSNKKDKKSSKKDKKSVTKSDKIVGTSISGSVATTSTNILPPTVTSITDVFAEELLEKAKKSLTAEEEAAALIKKGKNEKTEELEASNVATTSAKTPTDFDIPTISEISQKTDTSSSTNGCTVKSSTTSNREKDLAELAEIQKKIYAAKKSLGITDDWNNYESDDEDDFLNLKDDEDGFDELKEEQTNRDEQKTPTPPPKEKSPILFEREQEKMTKEKTPEMMVENHREKYKEQRNRDSFYGPAIATEKYENLIVSANNIESPPGREKNLRRSRERERREPPTPNRRPIHERLGLRTKEPTRNDEQRDRNRRQEKELYVPSYRRKEEEFRERDRERSIERSRESNRELHRNHSSTSLRERSRSVERRPNLVASRVTQVTNRNTRFMTPTGGGNNERDRKSYSSDDSGNSLSPKNPPLHRIGSRIVVAPVKPIEASDDDEVIDKPLNSVIKIKPRTPLSPSKQAPKNLLLRAVAEAQRSTILAKQPTIRKTSPISKESPVRLGNSATLDRNAKLYTKSYRDRMKQVGSGAATTGITVSSNLFKRTTQNLVIELENAGNPIKRARYSTPPNNEILLDPNEEYVPESISDRDESDLDIIYVPKAVSNSNDIITTHTNARIDDDVEEEEYDNGELLSRQTETKFVVTIDNKKKSTHFMKGGNFNHRMRSNSPPMRITSLSATIRNHLNKGSPRKSRTLNQDTKRQSVKSRLSMHTRQSRHSPPAALNAEEEQFFNDLDVSNSADSSTPPCRNDLIGIYRKPKEIKKIIIKNDSEDEELSPKKYSPERRSGKHQQQQINNNNNNNSNNNNNKNNDPIINNDNRMLIKKELSLTPPKYVDEKRRSKSHDEPVSIETTPTQTPTSASSSSQRKRKRTPITFDLDDKPLPDLLNKRERALDRDDLESTFDQSLNERRKISIRSSEVKKYDNIPSLSAVTAIDSKAIKPKEKCKYHPNCTKQFCEYYHPTAPCKSFPLCKYGSKCLYSHPQCKYDLQCTNLDCNYSHSGPRNPAQLQPTAPPLSSHVVAVSNYKAISVAPTAATTTMCKYYPNCTKIGCTFYHPKPCRFGKNCINKLECNFYHHEIQSSSKFKWVASAV